MSQLIRALEAVDTGDRVLLRPQLSPLFNDLVSIKAEALNDPLIGMRYRIGCKIEASAVITTLERMSQADSIQLSVNRAKQQVVEAIFGEFRQDIMRIHYALNAYDVDSARDLLAALERNMFDVS